MPRLSLRRLSNGRWIVISVALVIAAASAGLWQWLDDEAAAHRVDLSHYLIPGDPTIVEFASYVKWDVEVGDTVVYLMPGFEAKGKAPVRLSGAEVVGLEHAEVAGVWAVDPRDKDNELIVNTARYPPPYELHPLPEFNPQELWLLAVGVRRTEAGAVGSEGLVLEYEAAGESYSSFFPYKVQMRNPKAGSVSLPGTRPDARRVHPRGGGL